MRLPAQARKISSLTTILDAICSVSEHRFYNNSKPLIYISELDINNLDSFYNNLRKRHNIEEVTPAAWIKSRNSNSRPFLLTLGSTTTTNYIDMPGEVGRTKVYEYRQRPMFCNNCLEYTHSKKKCRSDVPCCRRCAGTRITENCTSNSPRCFYCKNGHFTGSKNCKNQQLEEEILSVQTKEKVTFRQAKQIFFQQDPDEIRCFADVTRTTPDNQRSAIPTIQPSTSNEKRRMRNSLNNSRREEDEEGGYLEQACALVILL